MRDSQISKRRFWGTIIFLPCLLIIYSFYALIESYTGSIIAVYSLAFGVILLMFNYFVCKAILRFKIEKFWQFTLIPFSLLLVIYFNSFFKSESPENAFWLFLIVWIYFVSLWLGLYGVVKTNNVSYFTSRKLMPNYIAICCSIIVVLVAANYPKTTVYVERKVAFGQQAKHETLLSVSSARGANNYETISVPLSTPINVGATVVLSKKLYFGQRDNGECCYQFKEYK